MNNMNIGFDFVIFTKKSILYSRKLKYIELIASWNTYNHSLTIHWKQWEKNMNWLIFLLYGYNILNTYYRFTYINKLTTNQLIYLYAYKKVEKNRKSNHWKKSLFSFQFTVWCHSFRVKKKMSIEKNKKKSLQNNEILVKDKNKKNTHRESKCKIQYIWTKLQCMMIFLVMM